MLNTALENLVTGARDLYVRDSVSRLSKKPSALEFYRYVARNEPVVIEHAIDDWVALSLWTREYLQIRLNNVMLDVSLTPLGNADAIVGEQYFTYPAEQQMTCDEFLEKIGKRGGSLGPVHYVQSQNDNLRRKLIPLLRDIGSDVSFATEALLRQPDAVNLWMGDNRSVTSLHKDHYENMYAVVTGEKLFILFPPTDASCLYEQPFPTAQYQYIDGAFSLNVLDNGPEIPWIPVDPLLEMTEMDLIGCNAQKFMFLLDRYSQEERLARRDEQRKKYPMFSRVKPQLVVLRRGEMLYLPSLYYHCVCQTGDESGLVVAINYWYDMDFDIKYNYYQFMRQIEQLSRNIQHSEN